MTLAACGALLGTASCDPSPSPTTVSRVDAPRPDAHAAMVVASKRLVISPTAALVAEDGHGRQVTVLPKPRSLDVYASEWRGRALDPVLHIGDLHFHHYEHPAREVMRFTIDDVGRLNRGDEVWLQWGDDVASRIIISRSLEVPR
ncbi:MAG: hypothetical protein AAF799_37805 [Myxococcota bacterium]